MSRQGTWCDALIIQGVAESMNLIIHIVESHHNFAEKTIIHPLNCLRGARTIFIGHTEEYHCLNCSSLWLIEFIMKLSQSL